MLNNRDSIENWLNINCARFFFFSYYSAAEVFVVVLPHASRVECSKNHHNRKCSPNAVSHSCYDTSLLFGCARDPCARECGASSTCTASVLLGEAAAALNHVHPDGSDVQVAGLAPTASLVPDGSDEPGFIPEQNLLQF